MPEMNQNQPVVQNQQTDPNQNQTTVQNQQNDTFDPNTLSPEARAYMSREIDRARTQASQTASNNTRKKLENEYSQTEQTMQKTYQDQIDALTIRACKSDVRSVLMGTGLDSQTIEQYVDMFSGTDIDASLEKARNFVSLWTTNLQAVKDQKQKEALKNMTQPQVAANTNTAVDDKTTLQNRLDEARKEPNIMLRDTKTAAIYREASEKGIQLF